MPVLAGAHEHRKMFMSFRCWLGYLTMQSVWQACVGVQYGAGEAAGVQLQVL